MKNPKEARSSHPDAACARITALACPGSFVSPAASGATATADRRLWHALQQEPEAKADTPGAPARSALQPYHARRMLRFLPALDDNGEGRGRIRSQPLRPGP